MSEGRGCGVGFCGCDGASPGSLVVIPALPARLAVNNGESCVAAGEVGLSIVQMPRYHAERQVAWSSCCPSTRCVLPMAVLYIPITGN